MPLSVTRGNDLVNDLKNGCIFISASLRQKVHVDMSSPATLCTLWYNFHSFV